MARGTCAICGKSVTKGPHAHGVGIPGARGLPGRPANMTEVKDMGPMPRTDTMLGSPPMRKRK